MQDDRREFFRIQETAWVLSAPYSPELTIIAEYFPQLRHMVAEHELANLDASLRQLEDKLDDDAMSRYLRLLNQKIDTFRRNLLIEKLDQLSSSPQRITVSEGGLSWSTTPAPEPGDDLALAIVFSPSYTTIYARAEVVATQAPENAPGSIHATFVDMPEAVRQELARHILAQQTRRRQQPT